MKILARTDDTLASSRDSLEVHVACAIVRLERQLHISFRPVNAGVRVRLFRVVHGPVSSGGTLNPSKTADQSKFKSLKSTRLNRRIWN